MFSESLRNTYAEVDITKFLRNIFEISKRIKMPVAPVLKANAYGHGAVQIAKACEESKASFIVVAFLEEAIQLRKAGIALPILVLNYFEPKYVNEALSNNISVTAFSFEQMLEVVKHIKIKEKKLKVHMNLDTGISRLGVKEKSLEFYKFLAFHESINLEGIYTHFAVADFPEDPMNHEQREKFNAFLKEISFKPRYVHLCNSAGALLLKGKCVGNLARIGIATYGLQPSTKSFIDFIQPVMSLHSTVSTVKKLKKGQSVGYGHGYVAKEDKLIATVPIGYADGFPRALSNKGSVLIHGKRAKVIGRVSMDQIVVDISEINNVKMGEDVVIVGKSGEEEITMEEIAKLAGTVNYEIVCNISPRVPRIYVKDSNESGVPI